MGCVYIVHCIDTEGPLYESLPATFQRLKHIFGIELKPSLDNLKRLQTKKIHLNGREEAVARCVAPQLIEYHDTWDKIDAMLVDILSKSYRRQTLDSFGNGWIFNWFCADHVGYHTNPRRRDIGYHKVFDHYRKILAQTDSARDAIYFHYHPMPLNRQAHCNATHYFAHGDTLFQILARRIIDRKWFPSAYRPGFHVIRPDSHWFLEQFIPFDFSNQAGDYPTGRDNSDLAGGRFGDWRRAPKSWQPYHPDHDDYRKWW